MLFRRKISEGSKRIVSHPVFEVKKDAKENKLKLKCRLTPHRIRDKNKEDIHNDASTAPLPIIPLILSLFTILDFSIPALDVKIASSKKVHLVATSTCDCQKDGRFRVSSFGTWKRMRMGQSNLVEYGSANTPFSTIWDSLIRGNSNFMDSFYISWKFLENFNWFH